MSKRLLRIKNYICKECAKEMNGSWPQGSGAIWIDAICDKCVKEKCVCTKDSWNYNLESTKH
jgi:hypothetical protein